MQHLDAWTWVIMWVDVIPLPHFISLLEKCFFDKWLQVLCTWLSSSPNYDEVTKWYMGWKAMFPEKLLSSLIIKGMSFTYRVPRLRSLPQQPPSAFSNFAYVGLQHHSVLRSLLWVAILNIISQTVLFGFSSLAMHALAAASRPRLLD